MQNHSFIRRCTDKLFGGIKMSWPVVIIFAVATALITAVFLILPIFENTSFREMGTTFEAWILFAIIIMTNCEKPLESALKTFVFFLVSQPLIYLFQVPFSYMGWSLFGYYGYWFVLTLFTFPMAFVGWYLKKRNWLSLLILTPMLLLLTYLGGGYVRKAVLNFPNHLIAAIFCIAQIALYLYALFDDWKKRLAGAGAVLALAVVLLVTSASIEVGVSMPLPDEPSFSDSAVITLEDSSIGEATITDPAEGYVQVHMTKLGATVMTVTDGDKTYRYDVEAKMIDGNPHVEITPKEQ